ncbi:hypothetical protein GCM10009716_42560 [Streptomyces sodiiphilus]|uniref:Uncharacterized protein n=1 Tax=Streptomyces sodiiphilus TaxID=226217 RepID=A0ABN2PTP9_9ACTN
MIASSVGLPSRRHTSRVGGSSETLHTEEQVIPRGSPMWSVVVTTPTPEGKLLIILRNPSAVTGAGTEVTPAAGLIVDSFI